MMCFGRTLVHTGCICTSPKLIKIGVNNLQYSLYIINIQIIYHDKKVPPQPRYYFAHVTVFQHTIYMNTCMSSFPKQGRVVRQVLTELKLQSLYKKKSNLSSQPLSGLLSSPVFG